MGFIMFWLGFITGSVPGLIVSRKLRKRCQKKPDKISKKEGE